MDLYFDGGFQTDNEYAGMVKELGFVKAGAGGMFSSDEFGGSKYGGSTTSSLFLKGVQTFLKF